MPNATNYNFGESTWNKTPVMKSLWRVRGNSLDATYDQTKMALNKIIYYPNISLQKGVSRREKKQGSKHITHCEID